MTLSITIRIIVLLNLQDAPTDDVWLADDYKRQRFSVSEALAMHRELRGPQMLNWPDAKVPLRVFERRGERRKADVLFRSECEQS